MTPEEINKAIAEWMGWKRRDDLDWFTKSAGTGEDDWHRAWEAPDGVALCDQEHLPNYYGDLNAIHEAEGFYLKNCKTVDQESLWLDMLAVVCGWDQTDNPKEALYQSHLNCVRATAVQRAEALLRTIGKWTDQPKDEDE